MAFFRASLALGWLGLGALFTVLVLLLDRKTGHLGLGLKLGTIVFWPYTWPAYVKAKGLGTLRLVLVSGAMATIIVGLSVVSAANAVFYHVKRVSPTSSVEDMRREYGELERLARLLPFGGPAREVTASALAGLKCQGALKQARTAPEEAVALVDECRAEIERVQSTQPAVVKVKNLALLANFGVKQEAANALLARGDRAGAKRLLQSAEETLTQAVQADPGNRQAAQWLFELKARRNAMSPEPN